jgi:hypothetical protein
LNVENVHAYRCAIGLYHNSDVDIGDIKVKYVYDEGKEFRDYGLWEQQIKKTLRQPYLEGSTQYLYDQKTYHRSDLSSDIYNSIGINANVHTGSSVHSRMHIEYNDDRSDTIRAKLKEYIYGY